MAKKKPAKAAKDSKNSKEAASKKKSDTAKPINFAKRSAFDSFRENVEALAVAIILAIIIRHFAVEAFEIPTGSMAPTLYGMHVWVECPNCPTEYNVAITSDAETGLVHMPDPLTIYEGLCSNEKCDLAIHPVGRNGQVVCQSCATELRPDRNAIRTTSAHLFSGQRSARCPTCDHRYAAVADASKIYKGNKILVNKFAYKVGKPERWDVIVFEFDQWKNYIKRLIGLPGEKIFVYGGDIYVNDKILRKLDHGYVQDQMWHKSSDSSLIENGLSKTVAWEETADEGRSYWTAQQERTRWSLNHPGGELPPARLDYRRGFDNYLGYNLRYGSTGDAVDLVVGDMKVEFDCHPMKGTGWVGVEIRDDAYSFHVRIPVGAASADRPAEIVPTLHEGFTSASVLEDKTTAEFALPVDRTSHVVVENVDDTLRVSVDGEVKMRLDYVSLADPNEIPRISHVAELRMTGHAVQAEYRNIQLFRDIYYIGRLDGTGHSSMMRAEIQLGENEYLAMGDNSASSSDGRYWGSVPGKNLMGKALLVFWPAWPLNYQCKFIR